MLLLDTCTLLWLAADKRKLSERARAELTGSERGLFVSAVSGFEIAARYRARLLQLPMPPGDWFAEALSFHGIDEVPVTGAIAARAAMLPPHHEDLCDRTIVATAIEKNLPVVTPDALIRAYQDVTVIW